MKKTSLFLVPLFALTLIGAGCSDADIASKNLSIDADYFKILRRIVFYNGVTGEYVLEIQGYCSLGNYDTAKELTVTCKTKENEYKKHFLGLSDNVTYFAEQIDGVGVSVDQYKVVFKPSAIIPDIRVK